LSTFFLFFLNFFCFKSERVDHKSDIRDRQSNQFFSRSHEAWQRVVGEIYFKQFGLPPFLSSKTPPQRCQLATIVLIKQKGDISGGVFPIVTLFPLFAFSDLFITPW